MTSNNDNMETVKRLNEACMQKDFSKIESMLDPNYTLKDPQMSVNSAKEFVEFMKSCPFDGDMKILSILSDGDKVVQIIECNMKTPVAYNLRMCDVITLKNGKVTEEEMFYDTSTIPPEAKEIAEKSMKSSKAA